MAGFVPGGREGSAILAEEESMGNQLIGMKQPAFDQLCGDLKSGLFFGCANRPVFYAVSKRTDQIDFLVPDGSEVNMHAMQAQADHYHCRTGARPTKCIMRGATAADGIVDNVVAA